jgi:hypothetical protein
LVSIFFKLDIEKLFNIKEREKRKEKETYLMLVGRGPTSRPLGVRRGWWSETVEADLKGIVRIKGFL